MIGEDEFGFKKPKKTRDVIRMLKIITERVFADKDELCLLKSGGS